MAGQLASPQWLGTSCLWRSSSWWGDWWPVDSCSFTVLPHRTQCHAHPALGWDPMSLSIQPFGNMTTSVFWRAQEEFLFYCVSGFFGSQASTWKNAHDTCQSGFVWGEMRAKQLRREHLRRLWESVPIGRGGRSAYMWFRWRGSTCNQVHIFCRSFLLVSWRLLPVMRSRHHHEGF